ncbi:adenine phosphoribosyltransferase, partial [Oerskovia sp. NPDC056781]
MSTSSILPVGLTDLGDERAAEVLGLIRDVPDYPQPGVTFRDITGLLADGRALGDVVDSLAAFAAGGVDL